MTTIEAGLSLNGATAEPRLIRARLSPPYPLVAQEPSLCGMAGLEMIFKRRGVDVGQVQLARDMGTRIPASLRHRLDLPVAEDPSHAGTDLAAFVGEPMQGVLRKYNLPLVTEKFHMLQIPDLALFLAKELGQDNDVLVNFVDVLGTAKTGLGHYALVSEIAGEEVTLCDPWPDNEGFYPVNVYDLAEQIDTTDPMGNSRGLVVFRQEALITAADAA